MSSRRDFLSTTWAAAGVAATVAGVAAVGKALSGSPEEARTVELPPELLKRAEAAGGLVHEGLLVRGPATAPVVLDLTCTHLRCRVAPIAGGRLLVPLSTAAATTPRGARSAGRRRRRSPGRD